jgi:hypothetical protein
VPDDVRPIVVIRVPDLAQEFIQSGVHTILFDCCVYLDVATGLLPVDPEQVITPSMILVLLARSVKRSRSDSDRGKSFTKQSCSPSSSGCCRPAPRAVG